MRFPFNERKAAQAAAYLLKKHHGRLNYMKLIKLLYLADRQALIAHGMPITGDRMVSMDRGPVLSGVLDLINWGEAGPWSEYVSAPIGYDVELIKDESDFDRLSDLEIEILDDVDARYGKIDRWSLVKLTHALPEWCDPSGSSFAIDPADILRAAGRSPHEIAHVVEGANQALLIDKIRRTDIVSE